MSRGPGKVETAVLLELTEGTRPPSAYELASAVSAHAPRAAYGCWPSRIHVSPAELASTKRALRRLEGKTGLVEVRSAAATQALTDARSPPWEGRRRLLTFWATKKL